MEWAPAARPPEIDLGRRDLGATGKKAALWQGGYGWQPGSRHGCRFRRDLLVGFSERTVVRAFPSLLERRRWFAVPVERRLFSAPTLGDLSWEYSDALRFHRRHHHLLRISGTSSVLDGIGTTAQTSRWNWRSSLSSPWGNAVKLRSRLLAAGDPRPLNQTVCRFSRPNDGNDKHLFDLVAYRGIIVAQMIGCGTSGGRGGALSNFTALHHGGLRMRS
jgi:hypothetical protein